MITFSMLTDKGMRENNEDSLGMFQNEQGGYCFSLADGLGGHGKGEVASRIAVDAAVLCYTEAEDKENFLSEAFEQSQEMITKCQEKDPLCRDMKTTLVVLQIEDEYIKWGHIGDSRLYYFEKNKLKERTLDHSVPQMLVNAGKIREKDIRHHVDRNRLLKVLGIEMDEVNFKESDPVRRLSQQAFLLCSDGFWELIDEKTMEKLLRKSASPEDWLRQMREVVMKNGKNTDMDNYSAIAVWIK